MREDFCDSESSNQVVHVANEHSAGRFGGEVNEMVARKKKKELEASVTVTPLVCPECGKPLVAYWEGRTRRPFQLECLACKWTMLLKEAEGAPDPGDKPKS